MGASSTSCRHGSEAQTPNATQYPAVAVGGDEFADHALAFAAGVVAGGVDEVAAGFSEAGEDLLGVLACCAHGPRVSPKTIAPRQSYETGSPLRPSSR